MSLSNYYTLNESNRRSGDNMTFIFDFKCKNFAFLSFHFKSIAFWNALPTIIKKANSYPIYKRLLKEHLLNVQNQ